MDKRWRGEGAIEEFHSPLPDVSAAAVPAGRSGARSAQRVREPRLECRLRLADGRVFCGELPAARHRAIQLAMLHTKSEGFVEITPGTRLADGRLELDRRSRPEHFPPAGRQAGKQWLERALEHAERIIGGAYARRCFPDGPREECFVGVAARTGRSGGREHVGESRWLWVDVDHPDALDRLYVFLAERPCHLIVQTAGRAGGLHCYWRIDRPLPATRVNAVTGEVVEPIERANMRLIGALGADRQCRDRGRVLRLAGSRNWKTGRFARIDQADLALAPYTPGELVGDLADADPEAELSRRPARPARDEDDPYRRIPAGDYMARVLGLRANRAGFVRCPSPGHEDHHPSCRVGGEDPTLWKCFACEAAGSIYDAASIRLGGPFGHGRLRGEDFKRARALVIELYGELNPGAVD